MRSSHRLPTPLLLLAFAFLAVVGLTAPAAAHGDTGTLGIEVTPGTAPLSAQVRLLLEYANDGDVAPGATVVAEAVGPDGARVGPVPATDRGAGRYDALLTMPTAGTWTVSVTSTNPAASASAEISVATTAATTTPSTRPADDVEASSQRASRTEADDDSSDGSPSPLVLVVIAVALVAAIVLAFNLVRRRARAG
jgi:hypothetical protein